jgi:nicotinamidase/pyrazinamidase
MPLKARLDNIDLMGVDHYLCARSLDRGSKCRALIVVDVQNDFCPGGALAVAGGDEIVAPINNRMADFDAVILTQDWHPAGHSSFANSHKAAEFSTTEMPYGSQVLWPDHCVQGSIGAAFHKDLDIDRADLILRKGYRPGIDSYSAFFENDRRTATWA